MHASNPYVKVAIRCTKHNEVSIRNLGSFNSSVPQVLEQRWPRWRIDPLYGRYRPFPACASIPGGGSGAGRGWQAAQGRLGNLGRCGQGRGGSRSER